MEFNLTTLLVMLGVLIVGWFIGFLDSNLRSAKKIKTAEAEAREKIEASKNETKAGEKKALDDGEGTELLRLWLDGGAEIKLHLDGVPVEPNKMTGDQRQRLIAHLSRTRAWLESSRGTDSEISSKQSTEQSQASAVDTSASVDKPGIDIVSQINAILQSKINGTPHAQKGIRLEEMPSGSVCVWVGVNKYDGIDALPEGDVKRLIKQAVQDWEQGRS